MERRGRERDRDEYAPTGPERDLAEGRQALASAMRRTEIEQLAIEQAGTLTSRQEDWPSGPEPPPPTCATPATVHLRPSRLKGIAALRGRTQMLDGIRATR
jgi:hypothetical protein